MQSKNILSFLFSHSVLCAVLALTPLALCAEVFVTEHRDMETTAPHENGDIATRDASYAHPQTHGTSAQPDRAPAQLSPQSPGAVTSTPGTGYEFKPVDDAASTADKSLSDADSAANNLNALTIRSNADTLRETWSQLRPQEKSLLAKLWDLLTGNLTLEEFRHGSTERYTVSQEDLENFKEAVERWQNIQAGKDTEINGISSMKDLRTRQALNGLVKGALQIIKASDEPGAQQVAQALDAYVKNPTTATKNAAVEHVLNLLENEAAVGHLVGEAANHIGSPGTVRAGLRTALSLEDARPVATSAPSTTVSAPMGDSDFVAHTAITEHRNQGIVANASDRVNRITGRAATNLSDALKDVRAKQAAEHSPIAYSEGTYADHLTQKEQARAARVNAQIAASRSLLAATGVDTHAPDAKQQLSDKTATVTSSLAKHLQQTAEELKAALAKELDL